MLFPELNKIMVNESFLGFRGSDRPNRPPLDLLLNVFAPERNTGRYPPTCTNKGIDKGTIVSEKPRPQASH